MPAVHLPKNCTVEELIRALQELNRPKLLVILSESPVAQSGSTYLNRCSPIRAVATGVQNLARQSHNLMEPPEGEDVDSVCLFPSD